MYSYKCIDCNVLLRASTIIIGPADYLGWFVFRNSFFSVALGIMEMAVPVLTFIANQCPLASNSAVYWGVMIYLPIQNMGGQSPTHS